MCSLRRTVILGIALALSIGSASFAQTTFHVDGNATPPGNGTPSIPFTSIQHAITAASSGDLVLVAPATYFENLDFLGKSIRLTSSGGAATTIVDGGQLGPVVRFRGGETNLTLLEGFTLRNGKGGTSPGVYFGSSLYHGGNGEGGGVHIVQATPVIRSCVITLNVGGDGAVATLPAESDASGGRGGTGGIECVGAAPIVELCTIVSNVGGTPGHASLTVAGFGGDGGDGGIGGSTMGLTLRRSTVAANVGTSGALGSGDDGWGGGGGIDAHGNQSVLIERSIIASNTSGFGSADAPAGGVTIRGSAAGLIDCLVVSNTGSANGAGGIMLHAGSLALVHVTIAANSGSLVGGLEIRGSSWAVVANSIVWGNQTTLPGLWTEIGRPQAFLPPTVSSSVVEGGFPGTGIIAADPRFRNPVTGDWRLLADSPCIDTADPAHAIGVGLDLEGNPRTVGAAPDMGAYESCFVGTLEDFILLTDVGGGDYENCLKTAPIGSQLSIYYASPGGGFSGAPAVLAFDLLPIGLEPWPVFGHPEIHLSPYAIVLEAGPLPVAGSLFSARVPPTVAGFHARFQAFVASTNAANGFFAASAAHDIAF